MGEFTRGQIVWLKSGSPKLTVIKKEEDSYIVAWVTDTGIVDATFSSALLTDTEPKEDILNFYPSLN